MIDDFVKREQMAEEKRIANAREWHALHLQMKATTSSGIKVGDWVELMNITDYQLWDVNRNVFPAKGHESFVGQKYKVTEILDHCIYLSGWGNNYFTESQLRKV